MPLRTIAWVSLLVGVGGVGATTYHVAQVPNASDNNPGSAARPWRTIDHAATVMQPGDTAVIHPGTYREWVAPRRSGTAAAPIVFEGTDRDKVILTGADRVTVWEKTGGDKPIYRHTPWTARFQVATRKGKPVYHHPADEKHRLIGRAEQVIVDGVLLQQVLQRPAMKPGTFYADLDRKALYVWLRDGNAPGAHRLEASTRGWVFGGNPWSRRGIADYIHLKNVTIRYAANHAQRGALYILGNGWRVENVTVEWTNGCGASFVGANLFVQGLTAQQNGQMGMGGRPDASHFEDIRLLDNNRKGYNAGWEAGGMKFACARDTVLTRVEAARNDGPGIWFDIDNRDCVIRQCRCHDNTGHGIFIEISGGFLVTDNVCWNNGRADDWAAGGICIGESDDCIVEHNTCVGNPTGISVREQGPRVFKGRFRKVSSHVRGFVCQFNLCALNTKYQFGLWSDNVFFGPHPSPGIGSKGTPLDPASEQYCIDRNFYYAGQGQGLILWGCPWRKKHRTYTDLAQFSKEWRQDIHSTVGDPLFQGSDNYDFRLKKGSPAKAMGAGAISPRRQIGRGAAAGRADRGG